MGRSKGVVVRPRACDGYCGCFVDTFQVRKLEDWPGLIFEAPRILENGALRVEGKQRELFIRSHHDRFGKQGYENVGHIRHRGAHDLRIVISISRYNGSISGRRGEFRRSMYVTRARAR
jgi:hypothetical protein